MAGPIGQASVPVLKPSQQVVSCLKELDLFCPLLSQLGIHKIDASDAISAVTAIASVAALVIFAAVAAVAVDKLWLCNC